MSTEHFLSDAAARAPAGELPQVIPSQPATGAPDAAVNSVTDAAGGTAVLAGIVASATAVHRRRLAAAAASQHPVARNAWD